MIRWNLLDDALSHSGPLLGPSESMRGGTADPSLGLLSPCKVVPRVPILISSP
jgi:hypothetical protein